MVVISASCACITGTRQLLTICPSSRTVQAPHSPSPHPSFVPVSRNCSRNTSSKRSIGCASAVLLRPFTVQLIVIFLDTLLRCTAYQTRLGLRSTVVSCKGAKEQRRQVNSCFLCV